jgi:hypothetical protein
MTARFQKITAKTPSKIKTNKKSRKNVDDPWIPKNH